MPLTTLSNITMGYSCKFIHSTFAEYPLHSRPCARDRQGGTHGVVDRKTRTLNLADRRIDAVLLHWGSDGYGRREGAGQSGDASWRKLHILCTGFTLPLCTSLGQGLCFHALVPLVPWIRPPSSTLSTLSCEQTGMNLGVLLSFSEPKHCWAGG